MANKETKMLKTEVIKRFVEDYEGFLEGYNQHRYKGLAMRLPSKIDRKIYEEYKSGRMPNELMRSYGYGLAKIKSAVMRCVWHDNI